MRKFTLFLMSLFIAVGAMAQGWTFEVIDIASNADEMLYTNAPCKVTTWGDDFKGWHVLFDDNSSTFFHSDYSGDNSVDGLDHYLRVDMGENNELSTFKFTFTTRNQNSEVNSPTTIVVEGSNEANGTYTEIKTITGIPYDNSYKYESEVLGQTGVAYRYIRYRVTGTKTNQKQGGKVFFFIAEFGMSKATLVDEPGDVDGPTKIDDFFDATTTFNTYSGTISNIINGNTSDKWWSDGAQEVDKTITVVLKDVYNVGIIKWYFCDGDKPLGAAIERRAADNDEWINVADFTIDDIENNIFTCTAAGADVKELRLRITTAHSNWLQVAEVELYEFLDVDKTGLQELIAEAEGLFDPIVVSGKVVGDNIDIEGKISSNAAQNPADGNASTADKDGAGIAGLTDTNPETYFHSRWGGTAVNADHYLQIDLGENGKLSDFAFAYQTRKTDNANATSPAPLAIEVRVSADGSNFGGPIATFTKDGDGLPTHADLGQTLWNSGVLSATEDIRYIRLTVTDSKGPGNDTWNGHHFFAMGTLNLYSVKEEKVLSDSYKEYISDDLFKAYSDAINAAKAVNEDNTALPNDVQNATEELAAQLDAIKAVLCHKLNVTNAGWATLYLGFNAEIPAEVEAYIVKGVKEGNRLDLVKVEGVLPANAGIIVKADADDYIFPYTADADEVVDVAGNLLKGTTKKTLIAKESGKAYYALGLVDGVVGFYNAVIGKEGDDNYKTKEFYNNAFKAYLEMPASSGTAAFYGFDWEGTTGVEEVKTENGEVKAIFDLTGRRVEAITAPGIYIVNGKKVLVK